MVNCQLHRGTWGILSPSPGTPRLFAHRPWGWQCGRPPEEIILTQASLLFSCKINNGFYVNPKKGLVLICNFNFGAATKPSAQRKRVQYSPLAHLNLQYRKRYGKISQEIWQCGVVNCQFAYHAPVKLSLYHYVRARYGPCIVCYTDLV